MIKFILAALLSLCAAAAFAAVDVNKASQAELESVKGIGPAMSSRILEARKSGSFADWGDLQGRVKGVGSARAAKLSTEGLTLNGATFTPSAAPVKAAKGTRPTSRTAKTSEAGKR